MRYLIGIDAGTTNQKAILFDENGAVLAQAIRPAPATMFPDGRAVYDADAVWRQVCGLLSAVTASMDAEVVRQVAGLAVTGMAEAGVPLSEAGEALYPFLAWYDPRTLPYADWWRQQHAEEMVTRITGLRIQHIFSVNKLLWLRDHVPEAYCRMDRWACMEDYIAYRLCGVLKMDYSIASRTMMMDLASGQWSAEILNIAGLSPEKLPDLVPSGTYLGGVTAAAARQTGLAAGTPVFTGGHDHICGALACGILDGQSALDSSGTAEEVLVASSDLGRAQTLGRLGYNVGRYVAPGLYYMASGIPASGASMDWSARQFPLSGEQEASRCAGANGLFFLPHLRGSSSPLRDPVSRGAFLGLRQFHTAADLSQAVCEGLCYEFRQSLEQLTENHLPRKIIAIGGGTKNTHWMQTKADISGLPIEIPAVQESTALGAALLAGIGAGLYRSAAEAAERVYRIGKTILPNPAHTQRYDRGFSVYRGLYQALLPVHQAIEEAQR